MAPPGQMEVARPVEFNYPTARARSVKLGSECQTDAPSWHSDRMEAPRRAGCRIYREVGRAHDIESHRALFQTWAFGKRASPQRTNTSPEEKAHAFDIVAITATIVVAATNPTFAATRHHHPIHTFTSAKQDQPTAGENQPTPSYDTCGALSVERGRSARTG